MKLSSLFIAGIYAGDHHRNLKQHNQEKEETLSQVFKLVLGLWLAIKSEWLQTEIKPRFCKTSENYFSGFHIGSRGYDRLLFRSIAKISWRSKSRYSNNPIDRCDFRQLFLRQNDHVTICILFSNSIYDFDAGMFLLKIQIVFDSSHYKSKFNI